MPAHHLRTPPRSQKDVHRRIGRDLQGRRRACGRRHVQRGQVGFQRGAVFVAKVARRPVRKVERAERAQVVRQEQGKIFWQGEVASPVSCIDPVMRGAGIGPQPVTKITEMVQFSTPGP
ncbi:hypothetical protein [Paracoccus aeridis]|uniref:hypothetical protein n=1 Tax=Paracoccus aeridis TaxID=1966466 RepID=UPI001375DCFA|nr:hypothetical protein [Paracoccus aeridis]